MPYEIRLTRDARRDLEDIHAYITEFESRPKADYVLDRLVEAAKSLATHPERGAAPKELLALGIREYRQTFFKPYRVIYAWWAGR